MPSHEHSYEHSQHTESTTLKTAARQHQQATPCVCGTCICAVLQWLVGFFGAYFVSVIDDLNFAAAVHGIAILDKNIRTVGIQDYCSNGPYHMIIIIIFPIKSICVSFPAITRSHV